MNLKYTAFTSSKGQYSQFSVEFMFSLVQFVAQFLLAEMNSVVILFGSCFMHKMP